MLKHKQNVDIKVNCYVGSIEERVKKPCGRGICQNLEEMLTFLVKALCSSETFNETCNTTNTSSFALFP